MSNSIPPLVCSTPPPIDDFVDQLDEEEDDDDGIQSDEDEDASISSTPKKSLNSAEENKHLDLPTLDDENLPTIPSEIQSTHKNNYDESLKTKIIEKIVHNDEENISNISSDTTATTTTTLTTQTTQPPIETDEILSSSIKNEDNHTENVKEKLNINENEIQITRIDESINNLDDDIPADIEINQIANKFNNLFRSESPPSLVLSTSNSFEEYDQPNSESEPSLKLDSINNSIDSSPERNVDNLSPPGGDSISQNNNENVDENDDDDNNFATTPTFETNSLNFDKSIDLENVKSTNEDAENDEMDENQIEIDINPIKIQQNDDCDNFNDSFDDFIVYSDMNNLEMPSKSQEHPTITQQSEENDFVANFDADFSQFNAFDNDGIVEKSFTTVITPPTDVEVTATTARTYSLDNFDDDDDFGDFDAVPIVNNEEKSKTTENISGGDDEDDDFGDFSDFSQNQPSIPIISTNLDQVFEMLPNLLEIMFPMASTTTTTTATTTTDEIHESSTIKKAMGENDLADDTNQYDKDFQNETTQSIKNFENSKALEHQWLTSVGKTTLVKALGIDSRNILYGGKWNNNMPRFAANLGDNPLEPVKSSGASITGSNNSNSRLNDIPAVQFDWNSSGLVNPLDASHAHTLLLDLEQLVVVAKLDKIKLDSSTCTSASSIQLPPSSSSPSPLSSSTLLSSSFLNKNHHYRISTVSPIKTTITTATTIKNTNNSSLPYSSNAITVTNSDSLFSFGGGGGIGGGGTIGVGIGGIGNIGGHISSGGGNIPFGCDCGADHISSLVDSTTSGISYFDDEHINAGSSFADISTTTNNLSSLNNLNTTTNNYNSKNICDGYSLLSSYALFSSSSLTSTISSTSPSSLLSTTITTTSKFCAPSSDNTITNINNNNNNNKNNYLNDILVMDKQNFTTNNINNNNNNNNTNQMGLFDDFLDIRVQEILHQANITQTQSSWMESDRTTSSTTKSSTSTAAAATTTTTSLPTPTPIPTSTIINPASITTSTDTTITFTTTTTSPTTTSSQFQSTTTGTMSENIEIQLNEMGFVDIEDPIDIQQLPPAPISSSYVVPGCGSLKETHIFTPNKALTTINPSLLSSQQQQQHQQNGGRSSSSGSSSSATSPPPSTTPPILMPLSLLPATTTPAATTTASSLYPDYDFKEAAAGIIINESVVKKEYRDVEYNPAKLKSSPSINDEFSDFQSVSSSATTTLPTAAISPQQSSSSGGILQPIKSKDSDIIINWPDPGNVIDQNTARYDLSDNFNDYTMNFGVKNSVNGVIDSDKVEITLDSLNFVPPTQQEDDFSDFIAAAPPAQVAIPSPPSPPTLVQQQFIPPPSITKEPSPMVPLQPSVILTPQQQQQQSSSFTNSTETISSVSSNINWPDPGIDPDEMARLEALFPTPKSVTSPSVHSQSPTTSQSPMKPKSSILSSSPKTTQKTRLAGEDVEWSDFVSGTGTQQPITNIINQHIGRHHHHHHHQQKHHQQQQSTMLKNPTGGDDDDWSDFVSSTPKMIPGPNFPSWNAPPPLSALQSQRPQFNSWNQPSSFFPPTQTQSINLPPLSTNTSQHHTTNYYNNNTNHNSNLHNIQNNIIQQKPSISLIPDLGFAAPPKPIIQLNPTQLHQHRKTASSSSSSSLSSRVSNNSSNNSTTAGYHQTKMLGKK